RETRTQPPSCSQHNPPSTPFRQTRHYSPARPSPLGPRSTNISTPPWTMDSPTFGCPQSQAQKPSGLNADTSFSPSPVSFSLNNNSQPQQATRQHFSSPIFNTAAAPATPLFFSPNLPSTSNSNPFSPASPSPATRGSKFADRYAAQVANPMKSSASLARSKTRKMFLNRVRNERDEGRFEARGEQMMRADYMAEKRRWEQSMARDMDRVQGSNEMLEDDMLPDESEIRALDEFISQEEAIEMAMYESMSQQDTSFSDAEYDDIFMTMPGPALAHQSPDMDMS
ncbi:uncharacterized protein N7483_001208, partial [Penicillium malachiteum]|uniref:uncharacterized protein n=1 Tax=Penicillium malachiteum TaxID=1324776 RepID=UPI00254983A1